MTLRYVTLANHARALWAKVAIEAFKTETDLTDDEDNACVMADLLTDLMHLCSRDESFGDFDEALKIARRNFEEEKNNDFYAEIVEHSTMVKAKEIKTILRKGKDEY